MLKKMFVAIFLSINLLSNPSLSHAALPPKIPPSILVFSPSGSPTYSQKIFSIFSSGPLSSPVFDTSFNSLSGNRKILFNTFKNVVDNNFYNLLTRFLDDYALIYIENGNRHAMIFANNPQIKEISKKIRSVQNSIHTMASWLISSATTNIKDITPEEFDSNIESLENIYNRIKEIAAELDSVPPCPPTINDLRSGKCISSHIIF